MKKNLLALFCIVWQYVISTGTISNTSIYQPQSVIAKLLIIHGDIKMRDLWTNTLVKLATRIQKCSQTKRDYRYRFIHRWAS